jgi:hypothetical protein
MLILVRITRQVPWGKTEIKDFLLNLFSLVFSEVRIVDKITDLPVNYSKYLTNRRPESVQSRASSTANQYNQQQAPQPQYSQAEPPQQYRSATYNYPGLFLF